ncbi:Uma2 family endonuclease [uncultured Thiothrix sp.]|uniref:Uma2 family endonuclease n=1 Tax=uncultured Thiothrix sp. TaxID=223185 RepID=UPI00260F5A70|nr:Uma2 family endonuclease [uncultured Thiothrix sp.]
MVEVLSKATRQSDRQGKRLEYLQLPSLQEYMLIEQVLGRSRSVSPQPRLAAILLLLGVIRFT